MIFPPELLHIVRLGFYAKASVLKHGGKNFPPRHTAIYGIYKRLKHGYKRRPSSDLKYLITAIKRFARTRNFDLLEKVASLERRFGLQTLGFELERAIPMLGVGAKRGLDEELKKAPPTISPTTWSTSN
jgi:hypothetical protein